MAARSDCCCRHRRDRRRVLTTQRISSALWIVLIAIFVTLPSCLASARQAADGCDWIGSGLEESSDAVGASRSTSSSSSSVRPVYLRCSQGSVSWLYPRGALRVVLRLGAATTAAKEFQGCIKLRADFAGANIYVEQHRTLRLLHGRSSDVLRPDGRRHCFDSHNGQVALFLESDAGGGMIRDPLRRETAAFDYDLQLRPDQDDPLQSNDPWQECRPCSVKETLDLFCSSDFVAKGSISSVYNDAQMERTLLTVRASRVIRQASNVFEPSASSLERKKRRRKRGVKRPVVAIPSKWRGMDGVEEDLSDNVIDDEDDDYHVGTLHVPLTCQVKHGQGEFVFMGRQRLGDAVLWCAPRVEEWTEMVRQARRDGSAQCRLQA